MLEYKSKITSRFFLTEESENGHKFSFWDGKNVLKLNYGNGYTTVNKLTTTEFVYFKWVNFMICKVYISKAVFKASKRNRTSTSEIAQEQGTSLTVPNKPLDKNISSHSFYL